MPEDGNGSGLVSLFWGLWIYWFFSSWCEHLSSLSQAKDAPQSGRTISPTATSAPNISAGCAQLEAIVSQILGRCGGIAVTDFLNERLAVYETIVAAFDAGDRRTLRKHVSAEVYAAFSDAIAAREGRQEKTETLFALIAPPEIVAALFDDAHAEISIRFIADSYKLSGSAFGQRRPEERHSVDVWTFGCTSSTGKWLLIATEADR
jgi:predicted lipid-binding transport protein (Tim44 family)